MKIFKIGDRFRRTANYGELGANYQVGFESTIEKVGLVGIVDADGYAHTFCNIELIDVASPVRTVERQEIVPGRYGRISVRKGVGKDRANVGLLNVGGYPSGGDTSMSAQEMREAAQTLTEMADALDAGVNFRSV